jgi:Zn finger protein HypA/HybF involved in hydrogenase expression
MTLAELGERMSNAEFEIWLAEEDLRADECPFCGTEPRDLGEYEVQDIKCPTCKHTYGKIRKSRTWQSSAPLGHSGALQGATL